MAHEPGSNDKVLYEADGPIVSRMIPAGTDDAHEGPRAFAEKRAPVWKGR